MIHSDMNVLVEILGKRSEKGEEICSNIIESGQAICTRATKNLLRC
jgi:hypothetical protein